MQYVNKYGVLKRAWISMQNNCNLSYGFLAIKNLAVNLFLGKLELSNKVLLDGFANKKPLIINAPASFILGWPRHLVCKPYQIATYFKGLFLLKQNL